LKPKKERKQVPNLGQVDWFGWKTPLSYSHPVPTNLKNPLSQSHPVPTNLEKPLSQSHRCHVLQPVQTCSILAVPPVLSQLPFLGFLFWFLIVISLFEKHWSEPASSSSGPISDAVADGLGTSFVDAKMGWVSLVFFCLWF